MDTRKTYYEGLCNRHHDLFMHYSTIRLVVLSFCIPLGALIVHNGQWPAGVFIIALAWVLNFYFAYMSSDQWLWYSNIDLWLEIGDTTEEYYPNYKEPKVVYWLILFRLRPKEVSLRSPKGKLEAWRDEWEKAVGEANLTEVWRYEWGKVLRRLSFREYMIQFFIFLGAGLLLCLLRQQCIWWLTFSICMTVLTVVLALHIYFYRVPSKRPEKSTNCSTLRAE